MDVIDVIVFVFLLLFSVGAGAIFMIPQEVIDQHIAKKNQKE